jgi:hypothetical protein
MMLEEPPCRLKTDALLHIKAPCGSNPCFLRIDKLPDGCNVFRFGAGCP